VRQWYRCCVKALATKAPDSARKPFPQQGDHKNDDADHRSDCSRLIGLFRHTSHSKIKALFRLNHPLAWPSVIESKS
jgi:hypothetical protein